MEKGVEEMIGELLDIQFIDLEFDRMKFEKGEYQARCGHCGELIKTKAERKWLVYRRQYWHISCVDKTLVNHE